MLTLTQPQLVKLLTAANKLLPTKTALRAVGLLPKQRTWIQGEGWRWIETVPSYFQGVTLEAQTNGYLSVSVHTLDGKHPAYVSIPTTIRKVSGISAFRVTVYADTLLAIIKTYTTRDMIHLTITDDKRLEVRVDRNVSRLTVIQDDVYYSDAYTEATKTPEPVKETAPMNYLPAPVCSICNAPAYHHSYADKPVCDTCYQNIASYSHKVSSRIEHLNNRADKLSAASQGDWNKAHTMAQAIPFGQPILVGHHSEKSDRAYRNRIWNTQKRAYEQGKKAEHAQQRAHAAETNRAISSDNPAAVLLLQQKLDKLVAEQETMKQINAAIRKLIPRPAKMEVIGHHGTTEEINARFRAERDRVQAIRAEYVKLAPQLAEMIGMSESTAAKLLTPDYAGDIGLPGYVLKNNSAEIRRLQKRIDALKAVKTTEPMPDENYGDIRLERNTDDNRLRLFFPGKPSREVIATLKRNGFHWSPYNKAWQRQLNSAAEYAAQRVIQFTKENSNA